MHSLSLILNVEQTILHILSRLFSINSKIPTLAISFEIEDRSKSYHYFTDSLCFLKDKNIDSGQYDLPPVGNVESAIACQKLCKEKSLCQAFVHHQTTCYLKKRSISIAKITQYDGLVAGPKYCRKYYHTLLISREIYIITCN